MLARSHAVDIVCTMFNIQYGFLGVRVHVGAGVTTSCVLVIITLLLIPPIRFIVDLNAEKFNHFNFHVLLVQNRKCTHYSNLLNFRICTMCNHFLKIHAANSIYNSTLLRGVSNVINSLKF